MCRMCRSVNLYSLAADIGLSQTTVCQWLQIKGKLYHFFLQTYHSNFKKRLIKTPKLYFYDTVLACTLINLETAFQVESHYIKGALFENLMILELWKKRVYQDRPPNLFFWRDRTGYEGDIIAEWGGNIHAIKLKSGATFQNSFTKNAQYLKALMNEVKGYVAYMIQQEGLWR